MDHWMRRPPYVGSLKVVVLDWAGTTVDFGSCAPVAALTSLLQRRGIVVTAEQARQPMGRHKKDHIRAITQMPAVAEQWRAIFGRPCSESDVEDLFAEFVALQEEYLVRYADPIPGVVNAVASFRTRGLKIGSTTGYTRKMMDVLMPASAGRGYTADAVVCSDEVPAGRPYPWMIYLNAIQLGCYPMAALVKIGDTPIDIEEGLNAGVWTVGLAKCGNEVGLTEAELAALSPFQRAERVRLAYRRLLDSGAHYVADSLVDVPSILDEIDQRMQRGECP